MKTAVFTIASKNYFAYVRTLMSSLVDSNPHMERYVVVVDELDDEFVALPRNFELLELDEINLPHPKCFQFRYDIMEFNTAVKPFAIQKLFEKYDRVIYLDPDIYVYQRLWPIEKALDSGYDFVLTPHFNRLFEDDGMRPSEVDIMCAGIYNLGFIALNKCAETLEMVTWWSAKLEYQCVNEQDKGIFVDQKWIDLIPGYYKNVCILHDSGLNVAYWNLSHRKIVKRQEEWFVNDEPLIFFHFSGLNVHDISTISKHQTRYTIADIGDASELFENYSKKVLSNEFDMWKRFKYSYNKYSDGRAVLNAHRKRYRKSKALQNYCKENPFECGWLFYGNKNIELPLNGVNLIGYLSSEHGVGEAARLTANCLEAIKIDWCGYDFEVGNPCTKNDITFKEKIENYIKYGISIVNVNADQMPVLRKNTPKELWNTYKIGIWYWELPEFPNKWMSSFFFVDEIWAPTKYIADCLKKCAKCPVYHMPPGIIRKEVDELVYSRAYYGLPEKAFLFLNMFDVYSISGRKNPEAAIKAFQSAFAPDDISVGLVLKLNNSKYNDKEYEMIKRLIGLYENIYIIARTMPREAVNGLLNTCNAAVSLHRSEGLGLLCEEAMFYGKPVIATAWSGNMDFMTEDTACLVDYDIIPIGKDIGPYEAGQKWADPNVEQAAEYMKKLVSDKVYYDSISTAAKEFIRNDFTPLVCGEHMKKRLNDIVDMIEKGEYTRHTAKNTELVAKLCMPCYQKLTGNEASGTELEQLVDSWSKGSVVNFHKIAVDMSKSDIARKSTDRYFVIKVYESILDRLPSEDEIGSWVNRMAIVRRTRMAPLIIESRIWVMESILKSEEFMGEYADVYRNKGIKGLIRKGGRKMLTIYKMLSDKEN